MASWDSLYQSIVEDVHATVECEDCGLTLHGSTAPQPIKCVYCFYKNGSIHPEGGCICKECTLKCRGHTAFERIDPEGYPDGYTCDDCGDVFLVPSEIGQKKD